MTRITTLHPKQLLAAALGLSFICATTGPARSASSGGLEGSLTAYPLDGLYKGTTQPLVANNEACRPGQPVTLEVRNGRFKFAWNERQLFDARIRPDGTFYATTGVAPVLAEKHMTIIPTLQGRVAAADVVADYGTRWCRYRLEASHASAEQNLSERVDGVGRQP
jgi:hypothetical protein